MAEPRPDLTVCCLAGAAPTERVRGFLRSVYDTAGPLALEVLVLWGGTVEQAVELTAVFSEITVVAHKPGRPLARAINEVMTSSRGRYVSVWDAGSVVAEGCLLQLVDFLDETPDAGVAGPKVRDETGAIQPVARAFPAFFPLLLNSEYPPGRPAPGWHEYAAGEADWYAGPGITASRLLLDELGGIHPHLPLFWPLDLCRRARLAGWHVHYLNAAQAVGSLAAWRETLSMGRGTWWRLWEACLLAVTWLIPPA